MTLERPNRIVVVGGGFAGMTLAQRLERVLPEATEVVVLSAENHLTFTPMLPEVAGRCVSPLDVVVAGRRLTRRTRWLDVKVVRIDRENDEVHYLRKDGTAESLRYAHAVLACGSATDMAEIPGLVSRGVPLKTVVDAIAMGDEVIGQFEAAAAEPEPENRRRILTVVVLGGGFSGVEAAGHIADLMHAIQRFYPELRDDRPRIVLLQKGTCLLPELHSDSLSRSVLGKLRRNGIEVRSQAEAKAATSVAVHLASGEAIGSGMIVCTVGTSTHPLIRDLGLPLEKGRLKTHPDMKVEGSANLWAIGDCALVPNDYDGRPSPPTAQFAQQQARQLAENLKRLLQGATTRVFMFRPRGMLASIGHRNGVAVVYGWPISGFFAWCLWRAVYLWKLPTISRKLEVALSWFCSIPFAPNMVQLGISRSRWPESTSIAKDGGGMLAQERHTGACERRG